MSYRNEGYNSWLGIGSCPIGLHLRMHADRIAPQERKFLLGFGSSFALLKNMRSDERDQFIVEILSTEGIESSKIEGELLERESLQSFIKQQFGLKGGLKKKSDKEWGMAELLCSVYKTYEKPLTHEMLWEWHAMLFKEWSSLSSGHYRTHPEPMQIVSGRHDDPKIFFEASPSKNIHHEMTQFIEWFNSSSSSEPILGRAALAHVYFESIHPFEDGNGRIGRVLVEKALSKGIGQPILIAVSKLIDKHKKDYYANLGRCNQTLEVQPWMEFFADMVLQAQQDSMSLLNFLVSASKMLTALSGSINQRQEKVLLRMFAVGPDGFAGGLIAEKYIAITGAPRATATRDLADLVEKGALVKTGELRYTRYWLNLG